MRRGGAFTFDPSSSAVWIVSGLILPDAPILSDRTMPDGSPMYCAGDPLGALLIGAYGRETANGSVFSVRWLWSGDIVGRAGGGGYDKQGAALADALTYMYGVPMFDGGLGVAAVEVDAARFGVSVSFASGLAWQRARDMVAVPS